MSRLSSHAAVDGFIRFRTHNTASAISCMIAGKDASRAIAAITNDQTAPHTRTVKIPDTNRAAPRMRLELNSPMRSLSLFPSQGQMKRLALTIAATAMSALVIRMFLSEPFGSIRECSGHQLIQDSPGNTNLSDKSSLEYCAKQKTCRRFALLKSQK